MEALRLLPRVQAAFSGSPVYVAAAPADEPFFRTLLDNPRLSRIRGNGVILAQLVECQDRNARCRRPPELLTNGSFDDGVQGWDGSRGEIAAAPNGYRGAAVEFRPKGTAQQYLVSWDAAQLLPGREYRLQAWIRSRAGKPLRLEFGFWDNRVSDWAARRTFVADGEWKQAVLTFRNQSPNLLSPIFWELHSEFGPFQVDEVEVSETGGL